jgi:hypothetical protein
MWKHVLETYRCLISCREKMPGMRLEDVFKSETGALASIKEEYAWLHQQASAAELAEQDGHIAQQPHAK